MAQITLSIDVTKVDKSRLKDGKNGQKYLDLTLIETPDNEYGNDFMVVHKSRAEEREAGYKSEILGNGRDWSKRNSDKGAQQQPAQQQPAATADAMEDDDIPF